MSLPTPSASRRALLPTFAALCLVLACRCAVAAPAAPGAPPRPDHVVVVIEENKAFKQIVGNAAAHYINLLAARGALFTNSYALTHPSQPNYLALFSGSTHQVTDNRCPLKLSGDNLASELARKGLSFASYSESMPGPGYTDCASGPYVRKHNPVANWSDGATSINLPFTLFPADYSKLPTVALVVPNQFNDMHDGEPLQTIRRGDRWLRDNLDAYVVWAERNNSLLILTWDEDNESENNRIVTLFIGPMVKPGRYDFRIDHYSVLRSLLDMYGLRPLGETAAAAPITGIWVEHRP